jgi:hypothetical protein
MKGYKDTTKVQYMDDGMPSAGESVKSGNRMSKMTAGESRKIMGPAPKARVAPKPARNPRMPSIGDSIASGSRASKMDADEARHMGVYKKGGLAVMPKKGKC